MGLFSCFMMIFTSFCHRHAEFSVYSFKLFKKEPTHLHCCCFQLRWPRYSTQSSVVFVPMSCWCCSPLRSWLGLKSEVELVPWKHSRNRPLLPWQQPPVNLHTENSSTPAGSSLGIDLILSWNRDRKRVEMLSRGFRKCFSSEGCRVFRSVSNFSERSKVTNTSAYLRQQRKHYRRKRKKKKKSVWYRRSDWRPEYQSGSSASFCPRRPPDPNCPQSFPDSESLCLSQRDDVIQLYWSYITTTTIIHRVLNCSLTGVVLLLQTSCWAFRAGGVRTQLSAPHWLRPLTFDLQVSQRPPRVSHTLNAKVPENTDHQKQT